MITFNAAENTRNTSGILLFPTALQIGGKQVVKNSSHDTGTDDHNICIGILENVGRGVHKLQQRMHTQHTKEADYHCEDQGQKNTVCHTDLHPFCILGPEALGGQNPKIQP